MAFRSSSNASSATAISSINPGKPTGTASTDVLIAQISGQMSGGNLPIVAPTGWTLVDVQPPSPTSNPAYTFWALGSVASTTFTTTAGLAFLQATIGAWTGRNNVTPITAFLGATASTGGATATVAPSVTAAANDDIVVFWSDTNTGGLGSAPAPLTEQLVLTQTNVGWWSLCTNDNVSAGATGTFTRTATNGFTNRFQFTIALASASSASDISASSRSRFASQPRHIFGSRR